MMKKDYAKLKRKYKKLVIANMTSLKAYRPEFDTLIEVYSGMLAQYDIFSERLIDSDLDIEVKTERGGSRKSATATAQEKLRTDLITYSDRLMLNPKALLIAKQDLKTKKSVLGEAMKLLNEEQKHDN